MAEGPIRIATVYKRALLEDSQPHVMDRVRWLRVSEGLADLGFAVDIVADTVAGFRPTRPNLRCVPYSKVDWSEYHVIKTLFHNGFSRLLEEGVESHPFIISKLGSVVGPRDDTPGVHFFGAEHEALYALQQRIHRSSRYVTVLTEPSRALWQEEFGVDDRLLLVPTGVDRAIPAPSRNPYPVSREKTAVYIGNIYRTMQRDVNLKWQDRLNALGGALKHRGIRLFFIGPGLTDHLDDRVVTTVGPVSNEDIWNYQYFADVGIALAQGEVQHNEASKIYYYLRTGLPVVSEHPIPNNYLIEESGCGLIAAYGDDQMVADMVEAAALQPWEKEQAIRYILSRHTWDRRLKTYQRILAREFESLGVQEIDSGRVDARPRQPDRSLRRLHGISPDPAGGSPRRP